MLRCVLRLPALVFAAAIAAVSPAMAGDIHLFPGDSFEAAAESLAAGDTLIVHAGEYADTGRISIQVKGTAAAPVVIRGADGEPRPLITRPASATPQNTINIEGAEYLTIRGLEISGNGDGITMTDEPSYITLEDLDIHDIDVGVNFRSSMHHITVRRNHIYRTAATGEGMYVGCNYATCVVSESLIEGNWIHDTHAASQGDGIEIKRGSHSNIIRDNVIHDTNYPCILLYGTEGNPRNVVEGNVMWNCGDSGIQAAADSVIRNNIIVDSPGSSFNSQYHQGVSPGNLEFVNNTIVGGSPCLTMRGWDAGTGLVFANNAVYCDSDRFSTGSLAGVEVAGNVVAPQTSALPASGYTVGGSQAADFADHRGRDVYPTASSSLLGAADARYLPSSDFNGSGRGGRTDAGAYTWTQPDNPGWQVTPGFKGSAVRAPSVSLSVSAQMVDYQGSVELVWSASDADSCDASGDWSGVRPPSGNETRGPLTAAATFELRCQGPGGTDSGKVSVAVRTDAADAGGGADSGGGACAWWLTAGVSLRRRKFRRRQPGRAQNGLDENLSR